MVKKTLLSIGVAMLSFSALAQNSGATKGVPFQDVQQVLQAASDALAAAVSANTSNIAANTAAIDAETAAREAEDAMLAAQFAAELALEALARMEGDMALTDAIAAEQLARLADIDLLGTRIDALGSVGGGSEAPGALPYREFMYEETDDYDINVLRDDLYALDYQPGEWLYMDSTFDGTGLRSAICTSHPNAYLALSSYALGGSYLDSANGSMTYSLREGSNAWASATVSFFVQPTLLAAGASQVAIQLQDREASGQPASGEIVSFSGFGNGNTAVIRAAAARLDACGF